MPEAVIKISGEPASAVRGYQKIIAIMQKMTEEQRKSGREGEKSAQKTGAAMDDSHRKTKASAQDAHGSMSKGLESVGRKVMGVVAGYVTLRAGISLIKDMYQSWNAEIQKNVSAIRETQKAFLELRFLGNVFKEKGAFEKYGKLATEAGISPSETFHR